ncbi:MAG: serine hydrolase domain-containing protein [Pseudomonadota bacterium]
MFLARLLMIAGSFARQSHANALSTDAGLPRAGTLLRLILLLVCTHVLVQIPHAVAREPIDPGELEAFLDGVIETAMQKARVVGVTLAVTQGDEIAVLKGYGFADLDAELEVDPQKTLFRIGSVSKLFTWTGLMQLREQGRVDFDVDINEYLTSLEVPEAFDQAVSLRHLFTHSAGFEERIVRLFGDEEEDMLPASAILNAELPARVRPPGVVSSYSNHGVGLAGLVLEEVSGQRWDAYVQEHILNPLEMINATAHQPLPEALAPQMSAGFRSINGLPTAQNFVYVPMGSAGGMSASALAMTRFARAHLGDGSVDGGRILSPESVALMRQPYFDVHPKIRPWLYGFANYSEGDLFIYGHSGGTLQFSTQFLLIPEHNISVFVSTNSRGGSEVTAAVHRQFLDRYFPHENPPLSSVGLIDLEAYVGNWSTYRNAETTPDSLVRLTREVQVRKTDDNRLRITGLDRKPTFWSPVGAGEFRREDKDTTLLFQTVADKPTMLAGSVLNSFYKLRWWETNSVQIALLASAGALALWCLLTWPFRSLRRRWGATISQESSSVLRAARRAAWLQSLAIMVVFACALGLNENLVFGLSTLVKGLLLASYFIPLAVLFHAYRVAGLLTSQASVGSKSFHCFYLLLGLLLSVDLAYWNLYGPYPW